MNSYFTTIVGWLLFSEYYLMDDFYTLYDKKSHKIQLKESNYSFSE